jgi:drug/metabolite transporter (DMT)-like permease
MKKTSWRNPLLLLLTAVIWGVAFVAQSVGMEYIGPFTFNCVRCLIGGLVLIPCIWILDRVRGNTVVSPKASESSIQGVDRNGNDAPVSETGRNDSTSQDKKTVLIGGVCCGIALFLASNLQQVGIQYTSVGKAGFITAMYIVLVPVLGIFLGKRAGLKVWISVALAVAGLYLLCITEGFSIGKGDILVLLCAFGFSVHILVIDYFSPKADGVRLSCIQFLVCGILSGICMFVTEKPDLSAILQAWMPILYAGVMSCGVAYTLQIIGQKDMDPTIASLILSLESVVSVLSGWALLGQKLSARELFGCVLMFAAIILAQLPGKEQGQQ